MLLLLLLLLLDHHRLSHNFTFAKWPNLLGDQTILPRHLLLLYNDTVLAVPFLAESTFVISRSRLLLIELNILLGSDLGLARQGILGRFESVSKRRIAPDKAGDHRTCLDSRAPIISKVIYHELFKRVNLFDMRLRDNRVASEIRLIDVCLSPVAVVTFEETA